MKATTFGSWLIAATAIVHLVSANFASAQESKAVVKAVGLSVNLPDPDSEYGGSYAMGRPSGIEVMVLAEDAKSFFISVVDEGPEKTTLELSANGKKLKNEQGFSNIGFMSRISDNGRYVVVPVSATQVPTEGATSVKVTGKLILKAGADEKKEKVKFKVSVDEKVKLGPVTTKITTVEESNFGEPATNITFETNQSLDVISSLKFFDEQGKEIEASPAGSSSFGFGDQMTYSRAYQVAGSPKSLNAEVTYFGSTRTVTIPVDLEVNLSLGAK
ncbi:MAG: hypothetical protein Q8M16_17860 [Pirellulaceae bacterium]|nr:hypothetical protein [Pirellulaceae bacterium]